MRKMQKHKVVAVLATAAAVGAGAATVPAASNAGGPVAGAAGGAAKTIKVGDDFFSPTSVKVKKGDKVKFKWLSSNGNPHNATLEKGPKGVKKRDFKSATGAIGIKFAPKFKKKGTYDFICTIHPTVMKTTVKVKGG
jgi:plastocyanin